jgi:prepilin-type N-terminal cleavage/methylation domain-containing protein/prepilin-type processing-associated H-X9-DG protein
MRRQRRHGFTLVELLVVIGIIAILISVLLPALNRTRDKARAVQCASNMRQLYIFCAMFAQDNKGNLPRPGIEPGLARSDPSQNIIWSGPAGALQKTTIWAQFKPGKVDPAIGALWRYIGSEDVARHLVLCPGDNGEAVRYGAIQSGHGERDFSYSLNSNITPPNDNINKFGIPLGTVKSPSEKIMFFEEIGPNDTWCLDPINNEDDTPSGRHAGQKYQNALRTSNRNSPEYRAWSKAGRGNHCFFDGHVELLSPENIFKNPKYWGPLRG